MYSKHSTLFRRLFFLSCDDSEIKIMANRKKDGFLKADSNNLPFVDCIMLSIFQNGPDFKAAEIRGGKNIRSTRESYGDQAIGYVQVQRKGNICTVLARCTPEHKNHAISYELKVEVDEENEEILSGTCVCSATKGGCKHIIAFTSWLHRRTEEKSVTQVESYWNKPRLANVGSSIKYVNTKDFNKTKKNGSKKQPAIPPKTNAVLSLIEMIQRGKSSTAEGSSVSIFSYFSEQSPVDRCDLHNLIDSFFHQCR